MSESGRPGGRRGQALLRTARLVLEELVLDDAAEMVEVLADDALYDFIGGRPPTLMELRERYGRLATGGSADGREEWRNWIVRGRADRRAVGTVQATIVDRTATLAWIVGSHWQGRGYATEAALAVVEWLVARGVETISANVHPDHHASAAVAKRIGLLPTDEQVDGERVWRATTRNRNPGFGGKDR